jgi:HK97 gp10 family phage protein
MTVSTGNLRGLVANLFAADARAQKAIRGTVAKYGTRQFRLTRQLAPVDTGFLRSHIRLRVSEDGLAYEVGVREKDYTEAGLPFYALYQEFGTRFMHAQPFIFPARDQTYPEFRRALSANVRAAMKRRAR